MKRIISALLALVFLIALLPIPPAQAVAAAQAADSDIRIMSANVYAEFPTWWGSFKPEDTSVRVKNLAKMLDENAPTAVCTQEMSPSWYTALEQLDTTKWGWLTEPDAAGYSYYDFVPNVGLALNSIIYRKDLLTLQGSGVEPYTARTNGHCIVWGVFTVNATGKQFVLISTHWTPNTPGDKSSERLLQAEQLAQKVNDLRLIYGDTVIVTGDFNCTDDSQEFRRFIANANAIDSRQWAKKRGDSLSKIDHIVATSDASFEYHTVCYEANNAYKISDHPFIVADVKLSTNLYFDFTDTQDARQHYKQGAYRFNAYDYHKAYWKHDSNRVTDLTINKSNGTLSFNVTQTGNPYVFTDSKSATELKNAYGLNFPTDQAEHAFIRFKLTNCAQIDTSTATSLTLSALNRSTGEIKSEKKTFTLSQANSGYITLHLPLSANGIRSLGNIDAVQLTFDNIKNGSVEIAYIYIGVNNYSPQNYSLMFDFSNTAGDQSRYKGASYGGYQFDTASNGYWATKETSTTSNTIYNDYTIDNATGTLSVKVAQGLAYNTTNGKYGPWLTTTKTPGTYPSPTSSAAQPLSYAPGNADFIQIRFKTVDCTLATSDPAQIVVVYDYDSGSGPARGAYDMVVDYTLTNDTYQIVTIPVNDAFKASKKITTFGFRFWHIKGTSSNAKVVIDSIFVGPEEAMPIHHVYDHKTVAATCAAQGYTSHTCRICGYSYKDSYTAVKAHTVVYSIPKTPTLSAEGTLTATCSVCGATGSMTLPKLNTTDYTKTTTKAPTCTATGTDTYTWKVTSYGVYSFTASVAATGHTEVIDKAVAPTCTATGLTEGKHCSVCNAVLVEQTTIAKLGHSYTYSATKKPTTSATGTLTGTCSVCNGTTNVTLPKLNTTDYTKTTTKAATCTENGTDKYTWKTTTYGTFSFNSTVAATGHTEVIDAAIAPTCTSVGRTEGKHCSVCKEFLVECRILDALGHTEVIDEAIAPTCTATGLTEGKHCSVCGEVLLAQELLETVGHTYEATVTAATCTQGGVVTYVCACGDRYTETIAATGHDATFVPMIAPTCGEAGQKEHYLCNRCGTIFADAECKYPIPESYLPIESFGHLCQHIVTTPTCTEKGYTTYICACGETYIADEVAPLGHNFVNGVCICGEREVKEPVYNAKLTTILNVKVGAEMQVLYTVAKGKVSGYESFYVEITKVDAHGESTTTRFSLEDGTLEEKYNGSVLVGYNATYTGIFASTMGDTFSAVLYGVTADGTVYYGPAESSSIKSYLTKQLESESTSAELKTLAVDMLNYGAAAQVFFDYDTENLVNADLTEEQKALGTQVIPEAVNSSASVGSGIKMSADVSLKSKVVLALTCRYKATENSDMKFVVKTVDGTIIDEFAPSKILPIACQGTYDNVGAKQMRQPLVFELYDGETLVSQSVTWSVESYVAATRENADSSEDLIKAVNAMLIYGDSAAIYLASTGQ